MAFVRFFMIAPALVGVFWAFHVLHVDGLLNGLRRDFEDADDDAPRPPPEMLQALESDSKLLLPRCQSAALLNLVLLLKRHLKGLYQLSDIRCQGFDPSDTATSRPVSRLTDGLTMNSAALSSLPPGVELAPAAVKPKERVVSLEPPAYVKAARKKDKKAHSAKKQNRSKKFDD